GRFAFAKCVVEIEAALRAFADRKSFEVSNGHAILDNERRVVSAQRQPILRRHAHHKHFRAASQVGFQDTSPYVNPCNSRYRTAEVSRARSRIFSPSARESLRTGIAGEFNSPTSETSRR